MEFDEHPKKLPRTLVVVFFLVASVILFRSEYHATIVTSVKTYEMLVQGESLNRINNNNDKNNTVSYHENSRGAHFMLATKDENDKSQLKKTNGISNLTTASLVRNVSSGAPAVASTTTTNTTRGRLCIVYTFGETGNQIITLAKGLNMARKLNTTLLVSTSGRTWSRQFVEWLEPHPEIEFRNILEKDISSLCLETVTARRAFFDSYYEWNIPIVSPFDQPFIAELLEILPNQFIRSRARTLICNHLNLKCNNDITKTMTVGFGHNQQQQQQRHHRYHLPFMSVHRRNMNPAHDGIFFRRKETCSRIITSMATNIDYNYIVDKYQKNDEMNNNSTLGYDLKPSSDSQSNSSSFRHFKEHHVPIILFTDGAVVEKDVTFPIRAPNASLSVIEEMWMMTLSEMHYGHPSSTMDFIVFHWRALIARWQQQQQQDHGTSSSTTNQTGLTTSKMITYSCGNVNNDVNNAFLCKKAKRLKKRILIRDWNASEGNQGVGMVPEECF